MTIAAAVPVAHDPLAGALAVLAQAEGFEFRTPATDDHASPTFERLRRFANVSGFRFREVAFEEYRLRRAAGENPRPNDYAGQFGIDTSGWPPARPEADAERLGRTQMVEVAREFCSWRHSIRGGLGQSSWTSLGVGAPGRVFDDLRRTDPAAAETTTVSPALGRPHSRKPK